MVATSARWHVAQGVVARDGACAALVWQRVQSAWPETRRARVAISA
jgi:hypothetical protein